jgi:hypothetical protein
MKSRRCSSPARGAARPQSRGKAEPSSRKPPSIISDFFFAHNDVTSQSECPGPAWGALLMRMLSTTESDHSAAQQLPGA